jgi:catechol 2,3-dioxygenase-like lactoylglutathione lyase family enzyme
MNTKIPGLAFDHIGLKASNYERSIEFYKALGATFIVEWGEGDGRISLWDLGNGQKIEIFANGSDSHVQNGRWIHLALTCDDVELAYQTLLAAGAKTQRAPIVVNLPSRPEKLNLQSCFVEGPDGEIIEICKKV